MAPNRRNKRVYRRLESLGKVANAGEAETLTRCTPCPARKSVSFQPIEQHDLEESMRSLSSMMPWDSGRFRFARKLQDAPRNHGRVDEMLCEDDGLAVAVKSMPNWWVQLGQEDFRKKYPKQVEQPWRDFAMLKELQSHNFPYMCNLVGIFRDQEMTYMVSSLATEGDLFSWSQKQSLDSETRETVARPIATQLLDAVRWLHDLGIAHGDLSLENVLITRVAACSMPQVKLIDFGMSTLGRMCAPGSDLAGKDIFRAPEVYNAVEYDAFLADSFSLGLCLYGMVLLAYPWETTAPGKSTSFDQFKRMGAALFLKTKKVRGQFLPNLCSAGLMGLMAGLLAAEPKKRFCLGESCLQDHISAWTSPWLCSDLAELAEKVVLDKRGDSSCTLSTMVPDSDSDSDSEE
ncbi:unnamed protein product [Polarella glacialis]|uniref:Protein kinase domain-containing protein n=1 Tax=Polarella glacialis TaxID=89957 RepID=A0A813JQT2_POLGL|nr:unnamed protein product [Polarella glacialis]